MGGVMVQNFVADVCVAVNLLLSQKETWNKSNIF